METFNLYSSFILESFLKLTRLCSWRSFLWVSVSFCNFLSNAEPFLFSPFFPTTSQSSSVYMIISCSCSFFMNFLPHPCRGSLYFTVNFLHGIFVTQTQDPLFRVLLWKQASSRHSFCSLFVSSQTLFGEFRRRLWFHEEFSCRQRLLAVFELEESQEEAKSLKGLTHKMHWVGKWSQSDVYCQETHGMDDMMPLVFSCLESQYQRSVKYTSRAHVTQSGSVHFVCKLCIMEFNNWSDFSNMKLHHDEMRDQVWGGLRMLLNRSRVFFVIVSTFCVIVFSCDSSFSRRQHESNSSVLYCSSSSEHILSVEQHK